MDVILLEKTQNLGDLGETVRVKPGFARNYLIPQGKAVSATPENIARFEAQRAELEKQQAETLAEAQTRADALNGTVVSIPAKAGDEGRLFGSIGAQDIASALCEAGSEVARHEVRLPVGPLRQTGDHEIGIHLHPDVEATVTVAVVPEA